MAEPEILFITRKWAPATGGMETYCIELTDALAKHEPVQVVALAGRTDGMPPGSLTLLAFPWAVLRRCLGRRRAPRILHLADMAIWPFGLLGLIWRDTQVVLSAHGTDVAYHRRGGIAGTLYGLYLKAGARILRKARVIANSRATARVAAEAGWHDAAVVPLATQALSSNPVSGPHDGTILFAGRLVERKGCAWFIREVLPLLPAGTTLKVAGPVWAESEGAALSMPGVDYLGSLQGPALAEAYRRAMCVIAPNIETLSGEYEGFGLIAPEAAVAGGVVLAADHGGLRDAVIDGETGFLLPSGDASHWAEKIREIASWTAERRRCFLERAAAKAANYYNWKRVAQETLAAYGAVLPHEPSCCPVPGTTQ